MKSHVAGTGIGNDHSLTAEVWSENIASDCDGARVVYRLIITLKAELVLNCEIFVIDEIIVVGHGSFEYQIATDGK
ncbi:MAG: hypothetical protein ACQERV_08715 [Bacteroidota bacterium]